MNILFLGAGRRKSLFYRFIEAAKIEDIPLKIFAYEDSLYVPIAPLATIIYGKKWTDKDFFEHLNKIIIENDISVIIPCMDGATVALSSIKNSLPNNCWAVVSSSECCEIFDNKLMAEKWFNKNNIKIPSHGCSSYPVIAKKIHGFGSRGQMIFNNQESLTYWKSITDHSDYMFQSFIPGQEYSIAAYVSRCGEVLGCVTRARLQISSGEVLSSFTMTKVRLENECRRILSLLKFEGPITLQAIENNDDYYFLEINPRFGGGVILSIEAGADYPRLILREAIGRQVSKVEWEPNLLMTRSLIETFHEGWKMP